MGECHAPDLVRAHEDRFSKLEAAIAAAAQERREDLRELRQEREKLGHDLEEIRDLIHQLELAVLKQVGEIRDRMIDELVGQVAEAGKAAKRAHERLDDHGLQIKALRDSQNKLALKVAVLVAFLMGTGFLAFSKFLPL